MLGNGFQYYFGHFWNFPNIDQMLDLGPLIYYRSTLKHIRGMFWKCYVYTSQNDGQSKNWENWKGWRPRKSTYMFGGSKTIGANDSFEKQS